MNCTLKDLLNVLDAKTNICIFKSTKEVYYCGLVYEALCELKEYKVMNRKVESMNLSLGNVNVLLSERY